MSSKKQELTLRGSPEFEQKLLANIQDFAASCKHQLSPKEYVALLLIGSYGRGEGGVEIVAGHEKPHNDLDFVIISKFHSQEQIHRQEKKLFHSLKQLETATGVEAKLSIIPALKLHWIAPVLIMYELLNGSHLLLGDLKTLKSLKRFQLQSIPNWDMRNLLINRASLLLINECLLQKKSLNQAQKRLFVRHIMKAIIGYGDTLLYFLDDYHWSYVIKQERIAKHQQINAAFKEIYHEASEFRFQPDYTVYLERDFRTWLDRLYPTLQGIHLDCESLRLKNKTLSWSNYLEQALQYLPKEQFDTKIYYLKNLKNILQPWSKFPGLNLQQRLYAQAFGIKRLLPLVLPYILYPLDEPETDQLVSGILDTPSKKEWHESYLHHWGHYGDINFRTKMLDEHPEAGAQL